MSTWLHFLDFWECIFLFFCEVFEECILSLFEMMIISSHISNFIYSQVIFDFGLCEKIDIYRLYMRNPVSIYLLLRYFYERSPKLSRFLFLFLLKFVILLRRSLLTEYSHVQDDESRIQSQETRFFFSNFLIIISIYSLGAQTASGSAYDGEESLDDKGNTSQGIWNPVHGQYDAKLWEMLKSETSTPGTTQTHKFLGMHATCLKPAHYVLYKLVKHFYRVNRAQDIPADISESDAIFAIKAQMNKLGEWGVVLDQEGYQNCALHTVAMVLDAWMQRRHACHFNLHMFTGIMTLLGEPKIDASSHIKLIATEGTQVENIPKQIKRCREVLDQNPFFVNGGYTCSVDLKMREIKDFDELVATLKKGGTQYFPFYLSYEQFGQMGKKSSHAVMAKSVIGNKIFAQDHVANMVAHSKPQDIVVEKDGANKFVNAVFFLPEIIHNERHISDELGIEALKAEFTGRRAASVAGVDPNWKSYAEFQDFIEDRCRISVGEEDEADFMGSSVTNPIQFMNPGVGGQDGDIEMTEWGAGKSITPRGTPAEGRADFRPRRKRSLCCVPSCGSDCVRTSRCLPGMLKRHPEAAAVFLFFFLPMATILILVVVFVLPPGLGDSRIVPHEQSVTNSTPAVSSLWRPNSCDGRNTSYYTFP